MFAKPFDKSFLILLAVASCTGVACQFIRGTDATLAAFSHTFDLLIFILPQFLAGLLIGGFVQTLISREWMERSFGRSSGLRGIILAEIGGALTPTGPFASFPLVYALWRAGADIGVLVAYLTAWALIGVHRVLVWEIPFMGLDFALLRFLISLPMPFLGGVIARMIVNRTGFAALPPDDAS